MNNRKKTGNLGESLAVEFLENKGHEILARQYKTIYGEVDIVSHANKTLHFVEVKTVNIPKNGVFKGKVSRETYIKPEENVTREKVSRIIDTSCMFMEEFGLVNEVGQIDLVCIYLPKGHSKRHYIKYLENINF